MSLNEGNREKFVRPIIFLFLAALCFEINLQIFQISQVRFHVSSSLIAIAILFAVSLFWVRELYLFITKYWMLCFLLILFLLSGFISVLFSPIPVTYTGFWLIRYIFTCSASIVLFYLISKHPQNLNFFLKVILLLAVVQSGISFLEYYSGPAFQTMAFLFRGGFTEFIEDIPRPAGSMLHPNILGCFLSLSLLVALYLYHKKQLSWKLFVFSVVVLSLSLSFVSSRNAYIVLSIPLLLLALNRRILYSALSVLVLNLVLFSLNGDSSGRFADVYKALNSKLVTKQGTVTNSGVSTKNTAVSRLELWGCAVEIFKDHPLTGIGPGGYNTALKKYASDSLMRFDKEKIENELLNAHNGALNVLCEFGISGMLIIILLTCYLLIMIRQNMGFFPLVPAHGIILGFTLSFGPDDFIYSYFYMISFITITFVLSHKQSR